MPQTRNCASLCPGKAAIARMKDRGWLNALWRRTSLTQRLLLLALIPTALTALLLVSLLAQRQVHTISELALGNAEAIASQTAVIAAEPMAANDQRDLHRIARAVSHLPHVARVSFGAPDGKILVDLQNTPEPAGAPPLRVQQQVRDDNGRVVGMLWLELSQRDALARQQRGLRIALLWVVAALLLAALVSWRVARWISRPLRKLAHAVNEFGRSNRSVAVAVAITDDTEIGDLQRAFNAAAAARHGMLLEQQRRIESATAELAHKNAELEAANVAKARFLAAATHDLRQPLYALTLISSTLARDETDPSRLDRITRIQECAHSLDGLFSELLNLSRLEAGSMQPSLKAVWLDDVFEQISRSFRTLAEQGDLRLSVRKTDLWVQTDPTMLSRILGNLVSNALDYTEHGGVLVCARRRGDSVRIDVWDTGIGIDAETRLHVFDEFFRADPGHLHRDRSGHGFGLGLATVRKLTGLLGAPVELQSRPGRGSLFSFKIPLARSDEPQPPPPASTEPSVDIRGMRVLVVDDDATVLSAITCLLSDWGCDVRTGETLEQALRAAQDWGRAPDIVISDLHLRDGVNGVALLRALDLHFDGNPDHPAFARLLITGETRVDRLREVAAARIPVLHKPVAPELLREAIGHAAAQRT